MPNFDDTRLIDIISHVQTSVLHSVITTNIKSKAHCDVHFAGYQITQTEAIKFQVKYRSMQLHILYLQYFVLDQYYARIFCGACNR